MALLRAAALLLLLAVVAVAANRYENVRGYTFEQYVGEFAKTYDSPAHMQSAREMFEQNLASIIAHNEDMSQTWKKGVNQFTDLSAQQMRAFFGYNSAAARARRASMPAAPVSSVPSSGAELPTSVDWRDRGVVSPVKNQGGCGSCWAFAATESIESAVAKATGKVLVLSTQNVVSCAPNPQHCGGTGGCNGATAEIGFTYVSQKGISSEAVYPYQAQTGTCKELAKAAKITGFVKLIENNYTDVVSALANVGPLAINIDASSWSFYSSGVYSGCNSISDVDINHVVQVVGYGTDSASRKDYWIVRNSWGAGWGEKGYMRLEKHSDGDHSKWCRPDTKPSDGTGCDGGPPTVEVCGSCGLWYDVSYATGGSIV